MKRWERKTLGDVCDFFRGLTYAKSDEVEISKNIVLRATNIDLETNKLDLKELKYINEQVVVPEGKKVRGDSLLICTASGSKSHLGKVAFIDGDYDFAFGGFMGMLTPRSELVPKFLFHLMTSDTYKNFIAALSDGANINNLKFSDLQRFVVPVPPLPEQQRIVAILDKAFDAIATARANAEQNRQNARILFESYLQSVFNQRGEGWVERYLVDISKEFGRGKSKHRPRNEPKLYGGQYPFIQTGDISRSKHWLTSYSQTYSEQGLAQSRLWPKGTICIAIVGATVGETAILNFDACFPDSVIGIVPDENLANGEYVEYLLQAFKQILKDKGKGTARDNINLGTFESQKFPFPSLALQNEIVATIDSLSVETQRLESLYQRKIAALDELKQSLLHQAFSGNL
ncbi:restriction endonuclease subunit S [Aeromonas veronii]